MEPEEQISVDLEAFGSIVSGLRASLKDLTDPDDGLLVKNSRAIERLATQVRFQWWAIGILVVVVIVKAVS